MRLGVDLRSETDPERRLDLAVEADRLGLWAVLIGGTAGTEATEASAIATRTDDVHLALRLDGTAAHPSTLAEELAVVDQISRRRALAVVDGPADVVDQVAALVAGAIVEGRILSPPPAQTAIPVWRGADVEVVDLTGDLDLDRTTIDLARDRHTTHLFVRWPGPLAVMARHLATRAADTRFPQIVADLADRIEPIGDGHHTTDGHRTTDGGGRM